MGIEHELADLTGITHLLGGSSQTDETVPVPHGHYAADSMKTTVVPNRNMILLAVAAGWAISQRAGALDNTAKTRAIFEINKGVNMGGGISVNDTIAKEDLRVPIENMIYIADGPSDIPSFSVVRRNGGLALAVYEPRHQDRVEQAVELQATHRVDHHGVADYRESSETYRWLQLQIRKIADRMIDERTKATESRVRKGPTH